MNDERPPARFIAHRSSLAPRCDDVLLLLSTLHTTIIAKHAADWSVVVGWEPEQRYAVAPVTAQDAQTMIEATGELMAVL